MRSGAPTECSLSLLAWPSPPPLLQPLASLPNPYPRMQRTRTRTQAWHRLPPTHLLSCSYVKNLTAELGMMRMQLVPLPLNMPFSPLALPMCTRPWPWWWRWSGWRLNVSLCVPRAAGLAATRGVSHATWK